MSTITKIDSLLEEKEELYSKLLSLIEEKETTFKTERDELEGELYRLQGEYRALSKLKEDLCSEEEMTEEEFLDTTNNDN